MVIQDLRIKAFEKIEHDAPTGGSGTGYCEYSTVKIVYDNDLYQIFTLPNWYTPEKEQVKHLKEITKQMLLKGYYVIINQETINKFLKVLGHC